MTGIQNANYICIYINALFWLPLIPFL